MSLRGFVVFVYVIAFIVSIIGILSIPQVSAWESLVFGFNVLVGFCGVLLAYYVYVDGRILEGLQYRTVTSEPLREGVSSYPEYLVSYSMVHVKMVNGQRQYGLSKSQTEIHKDSMIAEIVFEAQKLENGEFLEVTCKSSVASEMRIVLRDRLGEDYKVSFGAPSERGSVLLVERIAKKS